MTTTDDEQEKAGRISALTNDARFGLFKDLYFSAAQRQFEYGKWVLASLLAVHAGSLVAISQAGEKAGALYVASGPTLIVGIAITLTAGGMAWLNFSLAMHFYAKCLINLRDGNEIRVSSWLKFFVAATLWGTPLLGAASLAAFFIAATSSIQVLGAR